MSAAQALSSEARGPLAGYRVLELGTTVAGPFCARLMADFGAEVIKIEAFEGDPIRSAARQFDGKSLYAASILRNKRLIAVDLRKEQGREVVRRLVPKCDVVVENFRPGALEKWGLGYDELTRVRPDLVMVRISGFGQTGPYSARPGYCVICEAASGLRHITGDPDRPPARVAIALTDYITGLYAAYGALADMQQVLPVVLAIAAASLLYVAVADLIPSLHRRSEPIETAKQMLWIALGVAVIATAHLLLEPG